MSEHNLIAARFVLTEHAREMIAEREIAREWIEHALLHPQWLELDRVDLELRHALVRIPEFGGRILRVVYNETTVPPRTVTAYFDRTQRNRT
jgi:hypothetical protein